MNELDLNLGKITFACSMEEKLQRDKTEGRETIRESFQNHLVKRQEPKLKIVHANIKKTPTLKDIWRIK